LLAVVRGYRMERTGRLPAVVRGYMLAILLCVCAASLPLAAVDVNSLPKPTGYINDFANVVSAQDKEQLEAFCTKVEQQLGVQFALVTVDTIGDEPIRDFALNLGRKWGVGSKQGNQGVVLLLAIKDRKNDIDTGRGIEPYITDGFAGGTLRAMQPQLRAGDYGAALMAAAQSMAQQIARGKGIAFDGTLPVREPSPRGGQDQGGGAPTVLIILGIFLVLWLLSRGRRGGGGGGFWSGLFLGNLLGGGGGRSGGWGGGGFGGGSGGGGGFGGFGGGDFGGGGASSSW
jgi:uncharacterized protein